MATLPQEEIYRMPFLLVSLLGEPMHYTPKKLYVLRLINCSIILFLLVIVFTNFFYAEKETYVEVAESTIILIHTLLKYTSFMYFKSSVKKLLSVEKNVFWKYQNIDQNIVNTYNNIYSRLKDVQYCIIFGGYMCILFDLLRPLFTRNTVFPFEFWEFKDSVILDATVLILEHYLWFLVLGAVFGYDILYLTFSINIIVQLRLLKYKLLHLPEDYTVTEVIKCIKHHQILLWVLKQLQSIYSVTLLFHYFMTLFGSCVEMYKLILIDGKLSYEIIQALSVCMVFFQFVFYAYPAELIAMEFYDISNGIYMSNWYDNNVDIQKRLLTIMMLCQRQTNLSGGGIIDINMETVGNVIQKSLSVYAILRNLLNK